jgi:malto-oligosyltrehalose trehalohydrolase
MLMREAAAARYPMAGDAQGWYSLVSNATAGARYAFCIDGKHVVPDPASRWQSGDVHDPSVVIDPCEWQWSDHAWRGRPWEEAVFYEVHVGAFSPSGDFNGVASRLDYLADLGVTALQLMPVADFPGACNWGYDGALLFSPDRRYGTPNQLKALVDAAHSRGLMVFLDVVYNHFGPEGNYLHLYAPQFFTHAHHTPWGAAINFDGAHSRVVRDFFIHNALYWLEEYHFDGLRLDAVHAIVDDSPTHILEELAERVQRSVGQQRRIHLVLENDANQAHYLRRDARGTPARYVAQWNDDSHHALHVLLTGEVQGYYRDYAVAPAVHFARALAEGFAYQGEASEYRGGARRGETSADLPATAFVAFVQNHDQVGNRALGERLNELISREAWQAALAVTLLAPAAPLLFMGQEWAAREPFLFFCDFEAGLVESVRDGRRREFAQFAAFADAAAREAIPDPCARETFSACVLAWRACEDAQSQACLALHRQLLALRRRRVVPLLPALLAGHARYRVFGSTGIEVDWPAQQGVLRLAANLGVAATRYDGPLRGEIIYRSHAADPSLQQDVLRAWEVIWQWVEPAAL